MPVLLRAIESPPPSPVPVVPGHLLPALSPDLPLGTILEPGAPTSIDWTAPSPAPLSALPSFERRPDAPPLAAPQPVVTTPVAGRPVALEAEGVAPKADDGNWQRLQTIMRKHEARKRQEEMGSEPFVPAPAPPATSPVALPDEMPATGEAPALMAAPATNAGSQPIETPPIEPSAAPLPAAAPPPVSWVDRAVRRVQRFLSREPVPPPDRVQRQPADPGSGGATTVGGGMMVTGDFKGSSVTVAGDLQVGGSLRSAAALDVGGSVNVGGSVASAATTTVGGDVAAGGGVKLGETTTVGGGVNAGSNVTAAGITAVGGSVQAGGAAALSGVSAVGGDVDAGAAVVADGSLVAGGNLQAGGAVLARGATTSVGGNVETSGFAASGATEIAGSVSGTAISFGGGATSVGGDLQSGSKLTTSGAMTVGGGAQVGGALSGTGLTSVGGNLSVGGAASFSGATTVGGSVAVSGSASGIGGQNTPAVQRAAAVQQAPAVQQSPIDEPLVIRSAPAAPLQAVWPVQRLPEATAPALAPPAAAPARERDATDAQVEAILGRVEAAQPTQSRIELVTPRRPRPVIARQPAAPPASPTPAAAPIPTEIGPLPADLWTFLGETPPAAPPAPVIMRTVETAAPPAPQLAAAGDAPAAESGSTADADAGIDIDDLARQVYTQLKRRLSTDWERRRTI